jgi:hypothetical protein
MQTCPWCVSVRARVRLCRAPDLVPGLTGRAPVQTMPKINITFQNANRRYLPAYGTGRSWGVGPCWFPPPVRAIELCRHIPSKEGRARVAFSTLHV